MTTKDFSSFRFTNEDVLHVVHAVPVQRICPLIPAPLEPDVVRGPEGEDIALVFVTSSLIRDLMWMPFEESCLDFHQCAYGTCVRHEGIAAAFVLGVFVEKSSTSAIERTGMKAVYPADFDVALSYDPATNGYRRYYCEILSDKGDTLIEAQSGGGHPSARVPFASSEEMIRFVTGRQMACFVTADGSLGCMRLEQEQTESVEADLLAGQFDYWENLGIAREEEFESPYLVLIQPSVEVTAYPPTIV